MTLACSEAERCRDPRDRRLGELAMVHCKYPGDVRFSAGGVDASMGDLWVRAGDDEAFGARFDARVVTRGMHLGRDGHYR